MKSIICFFSSLLLVLSISAQPLPPDSTNGQYTRTAVLLARLCVNEAGWVNGDDCAAIYQAIMFKASHNFQTGPRTFERAARSYSSLVFNQCHPATNSNPERCRENRFYIPYMTGDLGKPRNWPPNLRWRATYRALWRARLEHAQAIVWGLVPSPCLAGTPQHWGTKDMVRARWSERIRSGEWAYAQCGNVQNAFIYRVRNSTIRPVNPDTGEPVNEETNGYYDYPASMCRVW